MHNNKINAQISLSVIVHQVSGNIWDGSAILFNGSVSVSASGGLAPYLFSLNAKYSVPNNNGYFGTVGPGTYTLNVKDANGLSIDKTVTVTSTYPVPSGDYTVINHPSSCDKSDGNFVLRGIGGTPPYMYTMDGGKTFTAKDTFTNIRQGWYQDCLIKDANGFLASVNSSFGVFFGEIPYFNCHCQCSFTLQVFTNDPANCNNTQGVIKADVLGGGGGSSFYFSLDSINFFSGPYSGGYYNYRFLNLSPGLYTVYAKDTAGIVHALGTSVPKYCPVNIDITGVGSSCHQNDGSLTITGSGATAPYTYSLDGINYQTNNTFTGLSSGSYNVNVKDSTGLIGSALATVTTNCPVITTSAKDDTCSTGKGTIAITASNGTAPYTYSINSINFFTTNTFTSLSAGLYKTTVKDANGFTDTVSVTVKNYCIQLSASSTNKTCGNKNGTITATVSGGTAPFQFSIDGINFQTSNIFSGLDSGKYTVTVKDATSVTGSAKDTILNIATPVINSVATTPATCYNTGGIMTVTGSGGVSPFQYSIDGTNYQSSNTFTNDTSGTYFVKLKDANGCIFTDTILLTKYPTPVVSLGNDTTICTGQSLVVNAGNNFAAYLWNNGATSSAITVSNAGKYYVTATDIHTCKVADTILVSFQQTPVFSLGNDTTLCQKQALVLQPNVTGTYLWQDNSTANKKTITGAGLYWLQVNNNNCIYKDSVLVSYTPLPVLQLPTDTTLCDNATLLLNALQNGSGAIYVWQDGSTASNLLVNTAGTYIVKVTQNGCSNADTSVVQYKQTPQQAITLDTSKCKNDYITLAVSFPNATYSWQDFNTSPIYQTIFPGTYYCTISNYCGEVADTFHVSDRICECQMTVPNAFSPNGDGINDDFRPYVSCTPAYYHLTIFNRSGQVIFETTNASNYWNGTINGKPVPFTTYYYLLQVKGISDLTVKQKSGSVTLLK